MWSDFYLNHSICMQKLLFVEGGKKQIAWQVRVWNITAFICKERWHSLGRIMQWQSMDDIPSERMENGPGSHSHNHGSKIEISSVRAATLVYTSCPLPRRKTYLRLVSQRSQSSSQCIKWEQRSFTELFALD